MVFLLTWLRTPTGMQHLPQVSSQTHDWPLLPHVSHPKAVGLPTNITSGRLLQSVPHYSAVTVVDIGRDAKD